MAEPFAGGAGASLTLLYGEEAPKIFINDADPAIRDFWWAATERHRQFADLLRKTRVNMREWRVQRSIYRSARSGRLRRGFSAFYLNRCNRSGIIMNGGPIGGIQQTGDWKIDARFNKRELLARFERISEFKSRIECSGKDGLDFIASLDAEKTFFFIDPPYYEKGKTLYLNGLDVGYHERLAQCLKESKRSAWVVTYDDCPEIRRMYRGWASIRPFTLGYAAAQRRRGREILITPKSMRLPSLENTDAIRWSR